MSLTWTGRGWDDDGLPPIKAPGRLYKVIGRTSVQRVRPEGVRLGERAVAFIGTVLLAVLVTGGMFFWVGVIQAWVRTR